jgi:hypothetical protein
MIIKEKAREIAEKYLAERKRTYTSICNIEQIGFWHDRKALYGKLKGRKADVFQYSMMKCGVMKNGVCILLLPPIQVKCCTQHLHMVV